MHHFLCVHSSSSQLRGEGRYDASNGLSRAQVLCFLTHPLLQVATLPMAASNMHRCIPGVSVSAQLLRSPLADESGPEGRAMRVGGMNALSPRSSGSNREGLHSMTKQRSSLAHSWGVVRSSADGTGSSVVTRTFGNRIPMWQQPSAHRSFDGGGMERADSTSRPVADHPRSRFAHQQASQGDGCRSRADVGQHAVGAPLSPSAELLWGGGDGGGAAQQQFGPSSAIRHNPPPVVRGLFHVLPPAGQRRAPLSPQLRKIKPEGNNPFNIGAPSEEESHVRPSGPSLGSFARRSTSLDFSIFITQPQQRVSKRIACLGHQPECYRASAIHHVFLLPSLFSGCGTVGSHPVPLHSRRARFRSATERAADDG